MLMLPRRSFLGLAAISCVRSISGVRSERMKGSRVADSIRSWPIDSQAKNQCDKMRLDRSDKAKGLLKCTVVGIWAKVESGVQKLSRNRESCA